MCQPPFPILYEDNHLLVVIKPAMLPTMGVAEDVPSLLSLAKEYIKQKYHKPGNVYLGIVSRLDVPTSGVVVMARTSKAASRIAEQFRSRNVEKRYWAIVAGHPLPEAQCVDWLIKDERHRRVHVVEEECAGARQARLSYTKLQRLRDGTLLQIELETGRKHQIRVQLAHRGLPVYGDRKYGSRDSFPHGVALHSRYLSFRHPVGGATLEMTAPIPAVWKEFGVQD
jgi:23S rRNA pseudouridine1911/1915/1917 synthase